MSATDASPMLIEPEQLDRLRTDGGLVVLVDVRTAEEYAAGTVTGARSIPAAELLARKAELPEGATIVTVCNHGGPRSCGAAESLRALGFPKVFALKGGVHGCKDH